MARTRWCAAGLVLVLACVLGVAAAAAGAGNARSGNIYEARVSLGTQAQEAQAGAALDEAFRRALEKVLVRVSGSVSAPDAPGMAQALTRAGQFVQSYRYVETGDKTALRVQFNDAAVNSAVRRAGLPVWGRERPQTLVWVGIRGPDQRLVADSDNAARTATGLVNTARARGIPVLFPLMDLQDQRQVELADIWGGFSDVILKASARYPHTDVLMASASAASGGWRAEWTLLRDGRISARWSSEGGSLYDVLAGGTHRLADVYAERFAVRQGSGGSKVFRLVVQGVDGAGDYVEVTDYLRSVTAVRDLQVLRLENGRVEYRVDAGAGADYLKRAIGLGELLAVTSPPAVTPVGPLRSDVGVDSNPAPTAPPPPTTLYLKLRP